jgi:formyl-CoA transferase
MSLNKSKRSLTLDLKSECGYSILAKLIKDSDVFVHNFIPKQAEKLGVDYDATKKYNNRLI